MEGREEREGNGWGKEGMNKGKEWTGRKIGRIGYELDASPVAP